MTSARPRESCVSCDVQVSADERSSNFLLSNVNLDPTLLVCTALSMDALALLLYKSTANDLFFQTSLIVCSGLLIAVALIVSRGQKSGSEKTQETIVSQMFDGSAKPSLNDSAYTDQIVVTQMVEPKSATDNAAERAGPESNWADLLAHMSHDLRTPLNAVIGFSYLMENEAFGPLGSPRYREYARHIQESGSALLKSAEDALAMTSALKSQSPANDDFASVAQLNTIVDQAWQNVQNVGLSRGRSLKIACSSDVEVYCDADCLQRVIFNLLSASIRHCGADGIISFVASVDRDIVQLEVATTSFDPTEPPSSFSVSVARALLELQGTSLLILSSETEGWRAITALDRVAQPDFFADDRAPLGCAAEQEAA